MILDLFSRSSRYAPLHPAFARAFEFLARRDLGSAAAGRHDIEGDRMYLLIDDRPGRGRDGARLEAHRRYIDLQLTIGGAEEIGWKPLESCGRPSGAFDADKDIGFFDDPADTWLAVPPGTFAIFFPDDAHAPLGGRGTLKKAIVKIAVGF